MSAPLRRSAALAPGPALAVVAVVVALGLLVDGVLSPPRDDAVRSSAASPVVGASTCAVGSVGADGTLVATTVVPAGSDASGWGVVRAEAAGAVVTLGGPEPTGRPVAVPVEGVEGEVAVSARWEDVPLLLSRRWTVAAGERVPGTVEGPCPTAAATRWLVPGVATAGGAAARLHMANPSETPASVAVTFTTPEGPVAPTRLANLVVPAHGRTTISLNEFVPEEPDLGIEVVARAGSVVVEAEQTLEAAVGGVDGRSLVTAHPEPATDWTVPWVSAGDGESTWVWVTNPTDRATDVTLIVHTAEGPVVPPAGGLTLSPMSTQRIDLRGALGDGGVAAVTVRSTTEVPVVASGAVLRAVSGDAVRGGIAVVAGGIGGDVARAAVVADASGRSYTLALANPGDTPATVDVTLTPSVAEEAPRIISEALVVPAGGSLQLALGDHLPAEGGFAVQVDASEGGVVAGLVGASAEGPLDLSAALLQPFPSEVTAIAPEVRYDRSLLHPIDPVQID